MPAVERSSLWWSIGVALLLLHPYAAVYLLDVPDHRRLPLAGELCTLMADLTILCAALLLTLDARLTGSPLRASMATCLALVAAQDAPMAVLALIDPSATSHPYRLTIGHLSAVLIALVVIIAGRRDLLPDRTSPLLLGTLLGAVVLLTSLVLGGILSGTLALERDRPGDVVVAGLVAGGLVALYLQLRRSGLPLWLANQLGLGILAIFGARLYSTLTDASQPPPFTVVGIVVFSALAATTATALLRSSFAAAAVRAQEYAARAAVAEATVRHDQELAHEVRAATAGIVAGAHLLASGRVPEGPRRSALENMVDVEAARLGRSLGPLAGPSGPVAVDDVIGPLVTAQRALGHAVEWVPSGHAVVVRRDDLAEIMNVLLNNAARHAHGRGTRVVAASSDGLVDLQVSDRGPGIAHEVRDRLFQWGARGVDSPGEGIGLNRAQRLVREHGGHLRAWTQDEGGTTFVVTLRSADAAVPGRILGGRPG
jgi:signal transduction histidine kinase